MRSDIKGETFPSHNVISGKMPPLLVSSAPRGWNGILLEIYPVWEGAVVTADTFHMVSLWLCGSARVLQRRNGRSSLQVKRAGNIIITPIGEPKEWEWIGGKKTGSEVLVLDLAPSLIQNAAVDAGGEHLTNAELLDNFGTRDVHIEYLAKRLLAEFRAKEFAYGIYVESLANQLAVHLLRHYSTVEQLPETSQTALPRQKLQRAIDYVHDNLNQDLTVGDIAEAVTMSHSHFARAFKQSTGLAPHRYVIECRMERAKSLLCETDLSVAEIARRVGFSTHAHFSVAFHRFTSCTPIQFRRRL